MQMEKTSRSAAGLIFLIMLAAAIVLLTPAEASAKSKSFEVKLKPTMKTIKVTWPKIKGAVKYKVYRADVTDVMWNDQDYPDLSKFKKVKTNKGKSKTRFIDKKVKKDRYYTYVIKAFNKREKQIACNYDPVNMPADCKSLSVPFLSNVGYGEDYANSPKKLYLGIMSGQGGVSGIGASVVVYRKAAGDKAYRKIDTFRLKHDYQITYADKTVSPGVTYTYQVQLYKKSGGKKYWSRRSAPLTIPAVNFTAHYTMKSLTPAGIYEGLDQLEITLVMANAGKYNGAATILTGRSWNGTEEYYCDDAGGKTHWYGLQFTQYSLDNVTWNKIPAKGVRLPGKDPLYLKAVLLRGEDPVLIYAGSEKGRLSSINSEDGLMNYAGPGSGYTNVRFDLAAGTGRLYNEYD